MVWAMRAVWAMMMRRTATAALLGAALGLGGVRLLLRVLLHERLELLDVIGA